MLRCDWSRIITTYLVAYKNTYTKISRHFAKFSVRCTRFHFMRTWTSVYLTVEEGRGGRTTVSASECQHSRLNCPSVGIGFVSPRASSAVRLPAHGLRLRRRLRLHSAISHLDDHRHGAALFSPARQRAALLAVQKTFLMFYWKN